MLSIKQQKPDIGLKPMSDIALSSLFWIGDEDCK
nr:MAG TPA: hypothetical protein [Caudoviricetes sp.]